MSSSSTPTTRRGVLIGAAVLTSLPILAVSEAAHAAGSTPKANVKFQNNPKGAQQCSKCNYFIPGASPTAPGQCKVVAGPIIPNGWCILFAAKHT
jgi:hypothetical protein